MKLSMCPALPPLPSPDMAEQEQEQEEERAETMKTVEKELMSLLHLALVQNLSRALMEECS